MHRSLVHLLVIVVSMIGIVFSAGSTTAQGNPTAFPTNTPDPANVPLRTATFTPSYTPTETLVPTDTLSPTPTITPTLIGPFDYPENFNPLTGLPYPSEEARNRRNLIVKISNYPPVVRPQYGVNSADIVYEYEAEGGVTRFAAIFRSQSPGRVGSIRSARLIDLELVDMYQSLLAYSGSNDWIRQYVLDSDWRWRAISPHFSSYECPTYCRFPEDGKAFEHTLFGDTDGIWAEADRIDVNQGLAAVGLAFNETPDPDGDSANDIFIDFYHPDVEVRWQYDPETERYLRWDGGLAHVDAATGEQIWTDNLVVMEVWHTDRPDVYESEVGGIALEHQIWGYARAWVFRDGQWFKGYWFRNRDYGSLQLRYTIWEADNPMHLKPGRTWIEIVRKFDPYATNETGMYSVEVSDELIDIAPTSTAVVEATSTRAAAQTATAETWDN